MNTTMPVGDPPMSFNFTASNNAGDFINTGGNPSQWQYGDYKFYTTDGTFGPKDFVIQPSQDPNIPWIIQGTSTTAAPIVGSLRISPVTGMIEMWDGLVWIEYGKPLNPPPGIIEPPKAEDDFELGGAL